MVGSNPVFDFNLCQPVELSRWNIDRFTGPNIHIAASITNVAKNSRMYSGKFGGGA